MGGRGSMAKFKVEGGRAGGKARIGIWIVTFLPRPRGFATLPKTGRCECVGGSKWPWRVESLGRASSSLLTVVVVGSCVIDCWHRNSISIAIAASKDGSIQGRQHPSRSPAPHGPLAILGGVWYGQSAASVRSFDVPDDPSDIPRNPGPSKIERLPGSCLCGATSMHLARNSIQLHSVDIRLLYAAAASKTSQQPSSLHPFIEPSSICLDGLCGQMLLWKSAQPVPLHRHVTQHGCRWARDGNGVSFQGNGTLTNTIGGTQFLHQVQNSPLS